MSVREQIHTVVDRVRKIPLLLIFLGFLAMFSPGVAAGGQITLYTSMPEAYIRQTLDAFGAAHPDIQVNLFRGGSSKLVAKLLSEAAAGKVLADVIMVADDISMHQLKDRGLLAAYPDAPVTHLPAGSRDRDMTYFGTKRMSVVLIYNKNLVGVPNSWKVLLTAPPGRVTLADPMNSGSALAHLWWMVGKLDWPFYETLSRNKAIVVPANGQVVKTVANGKALYGMVLDYMAAAAVSDGKPVGFVYPSEGAVTMHQPIAIPKGAGNPEDAKVLINFMLSDEGQRLIVSQGYRALIDRVGKPRGFPEFDEGRLTPVNAASAIYLAADLREVFNALFGH